MVQPPKAGGETRYGTLEPVRQYALVKLGESEEAGMVGRSYAAFFLALAERAYPEVLGERQVEWLERLEQEYDNLRAVMSWALHADDGATGVRMGWTLWYFWWARSYHREGRRWMEEVLKCTLPQILRGRALVVAGTLAYGHGDYERCGRYSEEGLEVSRAFLQLWKQHVEARRHRTSRRERLEHGQGRRQRHAPSDEVGNKRF